MNSLIDQMFLNFDRYVFPKIIIVLIKELSRRMIVDERRHPPQIIQYKSFKFKIQEKQIGSVFLEFEDINLQMIYSVNKHLEQVSYKTVVSALRQSEPELIQLVMLPLADKQYQMQVKVKLEYLHEIQQVFIFKGVRMNEERIKQINSITRCQKELDNLKRQILQITKQDYIKGKLINKPPKVHEVMLDIPYNLTVFSIALNFKNLASNVLKVNFSYFDAATRSILPSNMLPEQMFVSDKAEIAVIGNRNSFDKAILTIQGDFSEVEYIITRQKGELSQYIDYATLAKGIIKLVLVGLAFWTIRSIYQWVLPDKSQDSTEL